MGAREPKKQKSEFLFLLRTNVGYFAPSQDAIALEDKAKQASILFDEVVFEDGLYRAQAGTTGSFDMWIPGYQVTKQMIDEIHAPIGGRFEIRIGENKDLLINSNTEVSYGAQFLSLFRERHLKDYDWFKFKQFELNEAGKRIANEMFKEDKDSITVPFSDTHFVKSLVLKNLNYDLLLSAAFQRPISIDPVYEPLLLSKIKKRPSIFQFTKGFNSLAIVIPSFRELSWDDIADVRQMSALKEFRKKLCEFEQSIDALSFNNEQDYRDYLRRQFEEELLREIENLRPSVKKTAVQCAISLIPYAGSILAPGIDAIEIAQFHSSWLALVLKLRRPS